MKTAPTLAVVLAGLLADAIPAGAMQPADTALLAQRQAVARARGTWTPPLVAFAAPMAVAPADALDAPAALVQSDVVDGPTAAIGTFSSLGVIGPERGASLVLLSSGVAGSSQTEPGDDFPPAGTDGDRLTWTLVLDVPEGVNRLGFKFNFLSSEFPDFIGTQFNDTFVATVADADGLREVARASVNGSAFFPASATRAGGSGFDLFTEDPAGVDSTFGLGLPDAGLTGFQLVNVPVRGGGPLTLQFVIEDRGDGILDSAVVLDDLVLSSLETIDPNPDLLSGGAIIDDDTRLATGGVPCDGAAADGVTRVLLRSRVAGAGRVEFCLVDAMSPADGGVAVVGGTDHDECVEVDTVETTEGFFGFAEYLAPAEFNRGGDEDAPERPLRLRSRFTPPGGPSTESESPFRIVRPPLVLVHGLWSDAGTWTFSLATDPRFAPVTRADYRGTHASHFSTNLLVPFSYLREALVRRRIDGIAATQVDIAGHSMGGILSRNHVGAGPYLRNDNLMAGDFNKLITLNTPHTGSPLGNLVQGVRAIPILGDLFELGAEEIGHPVHLGAIEDLAIGSEAIGAITATPVPGHALVGTGGSDVLALIPGRIGAFYRVVNFFADTTGLFQGLQHDGIVGRLSQEGGMPASATTVFGGFGSVHIYVTGDSGYSDRLVDLLNAPATSAEFAHFTAPMDLAFAAQAAPMPLAATDGSVGGALIITEPADGTIVAPGATVHVVVDAGEDVASVLLVGPGLAEVDTEAPFEFDIVVPIEAVGAFGLRAIGTDGVGGYFASERVFLQVTPDASLTAITLLPQDPILFTVGESRTLTVIGSYSDGVMRDITAPSTGTVYETSSASVVSISDGMLTAEGVGVATIVARNDTLQDSVSATVFLENLRPVADAGDDMEATLGEPVSLDGTGSTDPDGGPQPLTFEWLQIDGPSVALAGPTGPTPSFVPNQPGLYTFSLVVRDGQSDSLPDSVTITVPGSSTTSTSSTTTTSSSTSTSSTSMSSSTSTTPPPTSTSTTSTIPGCAIAPTTESVRCRLSVLRDAVADLAVRDALRGNLLLALDTAIRHVNNADALIQAGSTESATARLRAASNRLRGFIARVRSHSGRKEIPEVTRAALSAAAEALRADIGTLRRTL